jgi:hypothetical protein
MDQSGEIISVDKSMIPFRGRLIFRQYILNKTHIYGVKFFKVCGSNGYTYKIIIYKCKQPSCLGLPTFKLFNVGKFFSYPIYSIFQQRTQNFGGGRRMQSKKLKDHHYSYLYWLYV